MSSTVIENVSDTAFWIAYYRAVETERKDALFQDPLARRLAGAKGAEIAEKMDRRSMTAWLVAIRTWIIDDYIARALDRGIDTVLNLGAGLDTRPYRLQLPDSLRWVEADQASIMEYKENLLAGEMPKGRLDRVRVDLTRPEERNKLFASLRESSRNVLVLTEGVIPYLEMGQVHDLARELQSLGSVRYWIVDYFSPETYRFRKRPAVRQQMKNAPFKFEPANGLDFFQERGWAVEEMRYLVEEGEKLHRPLRLQGCLKWVLMMRILLASQSRREKMRRFAGYALLSPQTS